ncbi:hypothetical protein EDC01DRAFT_644562 [Geopyxis carbonaria]|nr:hypothetical protein EDC01DRAFT_644562 [Geopyxis carbonaria]
MQCESHCSQDRLISFSTYIDVSLYDCVKRLSICRESFFLRCHLQYSVSIRRVAIRGIVVHQTVREKETKSRLMHLHYSLVGGISIYQWHLLNPTILISGVLSGMPVLWGEYLIFNFSWIKGR